MCGIAGYVNIPVNDNNFIINYTNSIKHRGPDEDGYYKTTNACIINTRLSIIDLSTGRQPFVSDCGKIAIVQNGEIYNFIEVRHELIKLGYIFKTQSDTEVILNSYIHWGEDFVEKLNGMFAIAIIDQKLNKLLLYRDRLGVKPLYIYRKNDVILFSSEIKSFLKYPDFDKSINYQSIHNYFIFNYIPIPETIFKFVNHIKPGHKCIIDLSDFSVKFHKYWSLENKSSDLILSEEEYIDSINDLLVDATKIRLRSDVPIGAFLSGGLDSSLICAYAKDIVGTTFNTYTIGFREKEFDESAYAKYIAEKYQLNNKVKYLEEDIISMWGKVTWYNDQPHGDISFIPTFILSEFAAKDHKVVLTGDGGDELFAGYTKHLALANNQAESSDYFDSISLFKENQSISNLYSSTFNSRVDINYAYNLYLETLKEVSNYDDINKGLYFDVAQLLPGNNLVKPDKMAMANSLETRSPFLDYRFYEMMFRVPGNYKLRENETKYILKKLSLRHFPHEHVYRKKQMFTVPIGEWFKNKLSGYLIEITSSEIFKSRDIFNYETVDAMVSSHISGKANYTRELRAIVNLEIWFKKFID